MNRFPVPGRDVGVGARPPSRARVHRQRRGWPRLVFLLLLSVFPPVSGSAFSSDQESPSTPPGPEVQLSGKLFCSLKRSLLLPFTGEITALSIKPGQAVKEGEVVARYRLDPEARLALSRRLAPPRIPELELKLAQTDRELAALKARQRSTQTLAQENLASRQSLAQTEQEVQALQRSRAALNQSLAQERRLARDDRQLLSTQLGVPVQGDTPPSDAVLLSPIRGHVVWIHPELRVGAELKGGEPVVQVGVMDPMVLKARVHEREATRLSSQAEARVTVESLPGRTFVARLSRLPWSPQALALEQPSYFEAEFVLPNPDLTLKEGLKATLIIPPASR